MRPRKGIGETVEDRPTLRGKHESAKLAISFLEGKLFVSAKPCFHSKFSGIRVRGFLSIIIRR